MKKILSLFVIFLALVNVAMAQYATTTIGDEGSANSSYYPVRTISNYGSSVELFTSDELSNNFETDYPLLTALSFLGEGGFEVTRNIEIYLAKTTINSLTGNEDISDFDNLTLVYSGEYTFKQGWNKIIFQQPFRYFIQEGNLALFVIDGTGGKHRTISVQDRNPQ